MADTIAVSAVTMPKLRQVDLDQPWRWLSAGWADLRRAPRISLTYGIVLALMGWVLTALIWMFEAFSLVLPLVAGFMLLGPILGVGLYETSRRLENGEPIGLLAALTAWRRNIGQISLMGLLLMLFLLAWLRIATLIFALFFSANPPRPEPLHLLDAFVSTAAIPFLAFGTAVGGVLAALVFAVSAVSIPILLDRDVNVMEAVIVSFEAVRRNFWTMALWAWLIVLFIVAGMVPFYLGLAVTLPLIGHATWHVYRSIVVWDD